MRKIALGILIVAILGLCTVVLATPGGNTGRYFIASNNGILRAITGVQNNFENGYTTELTAGQLKALERLTSRFGVEIEEVPLYYVLAKPICNNNGICEPQLGENASCANCKGGEEAVSSSRSCYPAQQIPWGIVKVNGGSGGVGVDVAVLDTGVYTSHLDLSRRVEQCKDFTRGFRIRKTCSDGYGHGTHVAGTVLADGGVDGLGIYGVAPQADLFAYKVCNDSGTCWSDDIATAIRHAADQKAEIISMSLGADTQSSLIKNAIDYATGKGVLIVAAAGNDGPAIGSIDYPGANVKVIAVGAIDSFEAVPDWSSRGVNDGDYIVETREVEFGAPGVEVESTWKDGCYLFGAGTSMATPHVSGLAAKLWQGTAALTRTYLQNLAKNHDLYTIGDDVATGFGLPVAQ